MNDETHEKPAQDKPQPRVIYTMVDKEQVLIRVVACGDRLLPEKFLGTDAMGVDAWMFIQWDRWMQPLAEKYLKLLAAGEIKSEDAGNREQGTDE